MIFARLLKLSLACGYKLCVLTLNFFVRSRCPVWYEVWIETVGDGGEGGGGGRKRVNREGHRPDCREMAFIRTLQAEVSWSPCSCGRIDNLCKDPSNSVHSRGRIN